MKQINAITHSGLAIQIYLAAWNNLLPAVQDGVRELSFGRTGGFHTALRKGRNPYMALAYQAGILIGWCAAFGQKGDAWHTWARGGLGHAHARHFWTKMEFRQMGVAKLLLQKINQYTRQQHNGFYRTYTRRIPSRRAQ